MVDIVITDGVTTGGVFSKAIDDNFKELKNKVDIISGGTTLEQIQSDWTQASTGATDYIKHKPTIPEAQIQADWTQASTGATDYIKHKPTIPEPQVQSDWNAVVGMGVILNKPIISGATEITQADWTQASTGATDYIKHKPTTFTPEAHTHNESEITNLVSDLAGKSSTGHTHSQSQITNLVSDLAGKSATGHTHSQYATVVNFNSHTGTSSIHFTQGAIQISESQVTNLVSDLAGKSPTGHTHNYEPRLSNPTGSSMALTSTTGGTRGWIDLSTKANIVSASFTGIYVLTQIEYDSIISKDPMTLYFIR